MLSDLQNVLFFYVLIEKSLYLLEYLEKYAHIFYTSQNFNVPHNHIMEVI